MRGYDPAMRSSRFILLVVLGLACAAPAQAQYFRNHGIQAPNIGWMGLGSTWDTVTGQRMWNIHDQVTIGSGFFTALGYQFWFDNQASLGASSVIISNETFEPIFSLNISSGLRYNFLEERLRPFVSAHIHYLQIISVTPNPPIPVNAFLGNSPFWVGLRAGGGVEWFFADEMAVQVELAMLGLAGANSGPPASVDGRGTLVLPATVGRLSYNIYF